MNFSTVARASPVGDCRGKIELNASATKSTAISTATWRIFSPRSSYWQRLFKGFELPPCLGGKSMPCRNGILWDKYQKAVDFQPSMGHPIKSSQICH